jgi:outer membrane protein assembly factor BamB
MYQANPAHTGLVPVSLDPSKFALRWVRDFGYRLSPVTAAGGHSFVCSDQTLYALDSASGQDVWSTVFGSFSSMDTVAAAASPSYFDGKVYIETASDTVGTYLSAYDAATGALVFKSNAGPGDRGETFYAPTIFNGKVYIQGMWGYGYIYSFDGSSGIEDWSFTQSSNGGPSTTPAVDDNQVYIYSGYCPSGVNPVCYNQLYAADRLTGLLAFEIPNPAPLLAGTSTQTPVIGGLSDLFVISDDRLTRFDLNALAISWENSGTFMYLPTVANGIVYAINNGILGAYNQETGTLLWTWETPSSDGGAQGTIIATNSHLFVTSTFKTYCIDLNTHQTVWSYPSAGNLSLGESTLYIACWDGTLTAFTLGTSAGIYVPEAVDFGIVDLGETVTREIPISNVGDAPLVVQSILSSSDEFVTQILELPITIGPNQSVSIDVQFTPVSGGTASANLLISSTDPDEPEATVALKARHTIIASANAGGQISPSSTFSVLDGDSFSFVITPNPGYQLASLILDGINVANPSTSTVTYTLDNVTADHTITAVFAHYFDYFGMQAGNHFESKVISGGSIQTITDDISVDSTSFATPSYIDSESQSGSTSQTWYQVSSSGLFMEQIQSSGYTFTFSPALPMIQTPITPGSSWTASSTVSVNGSSGTATISGSVSPQVLVNVPAGYFLAWPIAYTLRIVGPAGTSTTQMTYWFAPYFGTVKGRDSNTIIQMTSSAVGAGTVTSIPPVVTGVAPKSAAHGSTITVNGYQFGATQGTSQVIIGNVQCPVTSWSDTQIQCTVPQTAVSGPITVITDTWNSNNSISLTVLPIPVVTGVAPASGIHGSQVTINGSGFGASQGAGKVMIGNLQCPVVSWSDTQITCTVPAAVVSGAVTVATAGGTSNATVDFTVVLPPTVAGVSPSAGVRGGQITINGSWFGASQGASKVKIGSVVCPVTSWSDTQIQCTVPATAVTGAVTVVTIAGTSNATVRLTVMLPPVVSSIVPASGVSGSQVTIRGTGFGTSQGAGEVLIGSVQCSVTSWSNTQIVCTVPDTAVSGAVTVVTIAGTSNATVKFTVKIPPQLMGLTPIEGQRASSVQIQGLDFGTVQGQVKLGSVQAGVTQWADTSITFTVPATMPYGTYAVTVINSQGQSTVPAAFTVVR